MKRDIFNLNDLDSNNLNSLNQLSFRKRWAFRLAAVLLGLSPFLICELVLTASGWRAGDAIIDPYVGFTSVRPLFERSDDGGEFRIASNRKPLFCDESFLAEKPENGFRVFCVGGSTVQGRPFAVETAFPKWMQLGLAAADTTREYEVVNCGGVSYASYRLAPIVEELLDHQPDLIVIYTGHNEFLEDRTYESVRETPPLFRKSHGWLSTFKTYRWIRHLVVSGGAENGKQGNESDVAFKMPTEVEARLDYQGGLELYHRDEQWHQDIACHFELNLRRMLRACKSADVPVMLVNPVSNIRDASPFKSEHGAGMSQKEIDEFDSLLLSTQRESLATKLELESDAIALTAATEMDPKHALAQFKLGQTYLLQGKIELAKRHLEFAKEEDICPLRILDSLRQVIHDVIEQEGINSFDANEFFVSKSPQGIVGDKWLVDHVHPSIAGHQQLAEALLVCLSEESMVPVDLSELADELARGRRNEAYREHLVSLDNLYFELAKDRLNGLKRWASGEVRKTRD